MPDGQKVLCKWMVYSADGGKLYCFCCRLFANTVNSNSSSFVTGFSSWWKLNPKVRDHEMSSNHLDHLEKWKTLAVGLKLKRTIEDKNSEALETEKKKWRNILHRIVDIIIFLAKQNLAFRGHREDLNSLNRGNFLELVELLTKYDSVLREHLENIAKAKSEGSINSKMHVTYLSPTTQNEFINVLGDHVRTQLLKEIKEAKYYGMMFDSTPDLARIDQMSEIIRYVSINGDKVEVKEVFIRFFELKGKKADAISEEIQKSLKADGLDINLCRSQGYDNAFTMAGVYGGVQAKIKEVNPKALFNGCISHSLNLCGTHAFSMTPGCITFFGTMESLYTFFSASTSRWDKLMEFVEISLKRIVETQWSSLHEAVKPVAESFDKYVNATNSLCSSEQNFDTKTDAQTLLPAAIYTAGLMY